MKCPNCKESELVTVMTKSGVLVDYCPRCEGVWLDRGEIYYFTKSPGYLRWRIKDGLKNSKLSKKLNPRSGTPLTALPLRGGKMVVYYCLKTGGIWIGKEILDKLLEERDFFLRIEIDKNTLPSELTPPSGTKLHLPNLTLISVSTLLLFYGILSLILIIPVNYDFLKPILALMIGGGIAFIQFIISPFLMDITLKKLFKMRWISLGELPQHLQVFLKDICPEYNIRVPRIGIIFDGAPNSFAYGNTPNNARIVLTSGLIDLLEEEELEAVVAHEVGHAVRWDMVVMTCFYLCPMIFYHIYRSLLPIGKREKKLTAPLQYVLAIVAYIFYLIPEYILLGLSRVREFFADRFAGEGADPDNLASALVKIGYGLAGKSKNKGKPRRPQLESVKAMGIFDPIYALSLAIASYHPGYMGGGDVDKKTLKRVMRWYLWSPWAKYYELRSTHPLIAKRLFSLDRESKNKKKEPYMDLNERRPESYWDDFLPDLLIDVLPVISVILSLVLFLFKQDMAFLKLGVFLLGATYLLRTLFSYNFSFFPEMKISSLLKKIKVSAVRPVECSIKGKIIGRGVPGLIRSGDYILQDETGIMFLDYRQPLGIWNFLFGLLRGKELKGEEVRITGWYRRTPVPYIEVKNMETPNDKRKSYLFQIKTAVGIILTLLGGVLLVLR